LEELSNTRAMVIYRTAFGASKLAADSIPLVRKVVAARDTMEAAEILRQDGWQDPWDAAVQLRMAASACRARELRVTSRSDAAPSAD
jgi:hypothetical protein